jgi:energy-coupling factor transporter transmembrane protein EcfT
VRRSWHDLWGCGRGPVTLLAPPTRLLAGALVFAASVVAPATTVAGAGVLLAGTVAWLAACGLPARVIRGGAAFGLALFLPYFLLVPVIHAAPPASGGSWALAARAPWSVFAHGLSGLLVSLATVGSLGPSDLHEGLARLPVPRLAAAILVQIVHQTGTLVAETRRILDAMAIRGATGGGRAAWGLVASLPRVWLPRVIERADRVGAAMELRGYGGDAPAFRSWPLRRADALALALAGAWLVLGVAARWSRT